MQVKRPGGEIRKITVFVAMSYCLDLTILDRIASPIYPRGNTRALYNHELARQFTVLEELMNTHQVEYRTNIARLDEDKAKLKTQMKIKTATIAIVASALIFGCQTTTTENTPLYVAGADVNATGPSTSTPLHVADADLRVTDEDKSLHTVAKFGPPETISMLIAKGADVNARDEWENTPLHLAAKEGHRPSTSQPRKAMPSSSRC